MNLATEAMRTGGGVEDTTFDPGLRLRLPLCKLGTFVETPSRMETFGGRAHTAAAAADPSLTDICCIHHNTETTHLKKLD